MSKYLTYEIYAQDRENPERTSLIAECFMKGLAKVWIEETITSNILILKNKETLQIWKYDPKTKKWE